MSFFESLGGIPSDGSDEEIIEALARRVVELRVAPLAIFLLESMKPLSFVGSQGLHLLNPVAGTFFGYRRMERLGELLEERSNVEQLIVRIEELEQQSRVSSRSGAEDEKRSVAKDDDDPSDCDGVSPPAADP